MQTTALPEYIPYSLFIERAIFLLHSFIYPPSLVRMSERTKKKERTKRSAMRASHTQEKARVLRIRVSKHAWKAHSILAQA